MNKKKVVVVALAVSLVAILSLGSLAWFNAKDEITNKFYVATSDDEGAPEFSIDVKENVSNDNGATLGTGTTDDGNTYEWVVPGDEIKKNPSVTNTGDYDQWVRVNISISQTFADQVAEAQGVDSYEDIDFERLFTGFDSDKYEATRTVFEATIDGVEYYTYSYYFIDKLEPIDEDDDTVYCTQQIFEAVNIPTSFVQDDMSYGAFQIIVKADAVQADNTGSKASDAFTTARWEAGTDYDYPAVEPTP